VLPGWSVVGKGEKADQQKFDSAQKFSEKK